MNKEYYKKVFINRANDGICDGDCIRTHGEHKGQCKVVHISTRTGYVTDWGYYSYCENAIKCDKKNGFVVRDIKGKFL